MNLPEEFKKKMQQMLGEESIAFFQSYEEEPAMGLRINPVKISKQEFGELSPFSLESVPWAEDGFYFESSQRPGRHPYHEAGLYYIQDPSAMCPAELCAPLPGERVLDLCAAPGGKTTQLAGKMKNQGLLVANEIHPTRAKILSQNAERMGLANTVVTNETPDRLAGYFTEFFDRVLVDAPCSGEGMFRKDPDTREQWSLDHVAMCAERQQLILRQIKDVLKPGGRLVYSTCTFSREENEAVVEAFLHENPEFSLEKVQAYERFDSECPGMYRLWPHKIRGEGHFAAVLKKEDGISKGKTILHKGLRNKKQLADYNVFAEHTLSAQAAALLSEESMQQGRLVLFGENLYRLPEGMVSMEKLKVVRPGLHLGAVRKNRFEPSHALALALKKEQTLRSVDLAADGIGIAAYLKGETLSGAQEDGWTLVTVDGYSAGWAKAVGGTLKNHYPKGLRR